MPKSATPKVGKTIVVAVLMGLAIAVIGAVFWIISARLNVREQPELPWAAAATSCWLLIMLLWLGGFGWPRNSSAFRWFHLRVWRPQPGAWSGGNLATIFGLICALVGLIVLWILVRAGRPPVDVSVYPTTAIRFSVLIMGAVVSGVVEEAAFRGYMQSHLERIGPTFAILITSTIFTLMHATHGIGYLIAVAPGFFLASVIYGQLALKSGSILPGMALHCVGDAADTYFVLLGGNAALLFAS
jgi:membrane protease YdiL (CAAX protease family)